MPDSAAAPPDPTRRFPVGDLKAVSILAGLPDSHIAWFAAHGEKIELACGDRMFERGQRADFMFIVVSGTIEGYEDVGGQELLVATTCAGQVTGMLPFSRMTRYPRYTVAVEASRILRIRKDDFPAMLAVSQEVGQRLVAEMSDRVRGDVRLEQQQERMAALGRLSAGLAHELNNPAAAVRRAAGSLEHELTGLSALVMRLARGDVDEGQAAAISSLIRLATDRPARQLSALDRSQREEDLEAWLLARAVPNAWELAPTLVDVDLTPDELNGLAGCVPTVLLPDALAWIACRLSVRRIVGEIASSSERISRLVGAVKLYSHMDRSPEHRPTDVREGIDHTLTLLSHKIEAKAIRITRVFQEDLPLIPGNAGELNQVWTNLINNSIEAVEDGGRISIELGTNGPNVDVLVSDDGHGIPDEIRDRVFEPFFTTKRVGDGLGLGLDIAMRIVKTHRGSLALTSKPGRTTACVRLPLRDDAFADHV